jgi:hypothetical protein
MSFCLNCGDSSCFRKRVLARKEFRDVSRCRPPFSQGFTTSFQRPLIRKLMKSCVCGLVSWKAPLMESHCKRVLLYGRKVCSCRREGSSSGGLGWCERVVGEWAIAKCSDNGYLSWNRCDLGCHSQNRAQLNSCDVFSRSKELQWRA